MFQLVLIRDIFAPHRREFLDVPDGVSVIDVVPEDFPLDRAQIIRNGRTILDRDILWSNLPAKTEDQIILRVVPGVIETIVTTLVMAAISMGINALLQHLNKPENKDNQGNSEESPTYGWDGIQNTSRNGAPIPLVYGRHRVAGQLLHVFTKAKEDGKNYLYMLISLCAGPIGGVNDQAEDVNALTGDDISSSLKINNNPGNAYTGLEVSHRMGNWIQSIIHGFNDIETGQDQNLALAYDSAQTYTTSKKVQAFEVTVSFPNGLYRLDAEGSFLPYEVSIRLRYRESGGSWTDTGNHTFSAWTRSGYYKTLRIDDLDPANYEIELTRQTGDDGTYESSTSVLTYVNEITYDDVAYKGLALTGIKAIATDQLHGQLPNVSQIVYGKEITVYKAVDTFHQDTAQDFKAMGDGKQFWGWHADNTANAGLFNVNMAVPGYLTCLLGQTTCKWDASAETAPFAYKWIYCNSVDLDIRIRGQFSGGVSNSGDGIALMVYKTDGSDFYHIGLYNDSGTYKWRYYGLIGPVDNTGVASINETYYRIYKTGQLWYFYTSTDGESWTQRGSDVIDFLGDDEYLYLGVIAYSESDASGTTQVQFSEMEFADSTSYALQTTSNPAWVIYDLLTDTTYGIGNYINTSQVDLDTFIAFAAHCDELVSDGRAGEQARHRFDGVIDTTRSAWEQILRICGNSRSMLLKQGDKIRIAWLRAQDPVQIFSMSNIKQGTFTTTYQSPKIGANYWEVQYLDANNDWTQDYATYLDPDIEDGDPYRRQTVSMYGITRIAEAHREALFKCRWNRHITQSISFECGIDAIACEPYDVISISHDIPQWGESGRVVSSTSNSFVSDKPITISANVNYEVSIRHSDDTMETQTVSNSAGTYTTITISGSWDTNPSADDIWILGEENILTKPFLVTGIQRTNDLECRIEAIEYNSDIFDETIDQIPYVDYTALPDPRQFPADVENVILAERAQLMPDGTLNAAIDVSFNGADDAISYDVYWREYEKEAWIHAGSTVGRHLVIQGNITVNISYEVVVVSVGPYGAKKDPSAITTPQQITVIGSATVPPDVTNLRVAQSGNVLYLRWDPVDVAGLQGYEVRYGPSTWRAATVLAFVETKTEYVTNNFAPGAAYYQVKALTYSSVYSANAAYVSTTIEDRINENIIKEFDAPNESPAWIGTKTDMTVNGSNHLELDDGYTAGSYETPEIDATATSGVSIRALVSCYILVTQTDETTTWADATFTWESSTAQNTLWSGSNEIDAVEHTLKFRYGDTSGALGSYALFAPGEYTGRYWQFKVEVTSDSTEYGLEIEELDIKIDPPDIFCSGENISCLGAGSLTTITFTNYGPGFNVTPHLTVSPQGGAAGDTVQLVSLTATQFQVRYYDASQSAITGDISFIARGY